MTRIPRRTGTGTTLRQALTALSVSAAFAVVGLACDAEDGLSSGDFGEFRERRPCTGAFTPHSEACWEDPGDAGEDELAANDQISQERRAEVAGMNRCAAGLVGAPGTPGKLTVTFTTVKVGGLYAPRNCGAVWIEDSFREYMRTLELWAGERMMSVVQWHTRACLSDPGIGKPDVMTSATLNEPKTHTTTWDTKDFRGNVVPDGQYTLWLQVTENEIFPEGPFVEIPITKGAAPQSFTVPNQAGFKDITITYQPAPP